MKLRIILAVLLCFLSSGMEGQQKYTVTWNYDNMSFLDFVAVAEANLPVSFFFKEEWVSGLTFHKDINCTDLSCLLDNLFNGTALGYKIDEDGNVVIIKSFTRTSSRTSGREENVIRRLNYTDSLERQNKIQVLNLEVGNPADAGKAGNVLISGYVTESDSREPLAGVSVYVSEMHKGTITNAQGYYSFTLPRGNYNFRYSFLGMREARVNLSLFGPGEMNIEMTGILIPLKETVVSGEKNLILQRSEAGVEKINMPSFRLLPALMGESDIIKSLLLLPGILSTGEGSAGFYVRGGSADQNLVLVDGAQVYNPSHYFGFFSSVNPDIIKDVTLYKGGIPGRFGGRISSVLDIETKEGSNKEFSGSAGISPLTTHFMAEGPVIKDKLSYLVAGRTTYSDWILGLIRNTSLKASKVSFYDFNGKISWDPDKMNRLDISGYYSRDMMEFSGSTKYSYENAVFNAGWKHFFNSHFIALFSFSDSHYDSDITQNSVPAESYVLTHRINSASLKADFNVFPVRHEINFGTELRLHSLLPGSFRPVNDSSLIKLHEIERDRALEGAFYIDDKFRLSEYLSVNAGIRLSSFLGFGPRTVYHYDPYLSKSNSTITDTIYYSAGEVYSKFMIPEIRLAINLRISGNNSLKINYNRTSQFIHLLSNTTSIAPTDTWKLCDNYLRPERGDQFAAGFYRLWFGKKVETSAEIYYKEIRNMIDFKGGTALTLVKNIEQDIINVRGKAYGIELSLKKTEGKFRYNLGYTYSRTFCRSITSFRDELINDGSWYPANYDRPEDLTVSINYLYSRRLSFSSNYTYSTGRPVTYPIARYTIDNIFLIHYSDRNSYRIPDYSRLDVSVQLNGNLKSRKIARPYWTFSIINLFARENAYSVYFLKNGITTIQGYKLSVFGRAIPSVTFNCEFK